MKLNCNFINSLGDVSHDKYNKGKVNVCFKGTSLEAKYRNNVLEYVH